MNHKILASILTFALGVSVFAGCSWHQSLETESDENTVEVEIFDTATETTIVSANTHAEATDYSWSTSDIVDITLDGNSADCDSKNVDIDEDEVKIEVSGVYRLMGNFNGEIEVDLDDKEDTDTVYVILDGVSVTSSDSAAFYVDDAEKVILVIADGSTNSLVDAADYDLDDGEDEPNSAVFSKADLTIYGEGNGTLAVTGNYADGIASKDGLIIKNADVTVTAADDGIRGKDYLVIEDSDVAVIAAGDGLKSSNDTDDGTGFISFSGGNLTVEAGSDAIVAATDVTIDGGNVDLTSGGGSANGATHSEGMGGRGFENSSTSSDDDTSMKGIRAGNDITIESGKINISSADDALHSENTLTINGGTIKISSGDDGIHADSAVTINGSTIDIAKSYEGIESTVITINGGTISLVASDDGLNVAGGNDSSGSMRGGMDQAEEGAYLYINGGYLYVNASGDGLDSNGSVEVTGGTTIVDGPTNSGNGPLDYNGSFTVTGGFVLAAGSSGMAQGASSSSTQNSVLINFDSSQVAETLVYIQNSAGENVLAYAPAKTFQSIFLTSADLETGETYTIYVGGSCSGSETDGLYSGGDCSGGVEYDTFTVESSTTSVGSGGGMGGGGGPGGGGMMDGDRPEGGMRGGFSEMELPDGWDSMTEDERRSWMEENRENMNPPPEMEAGFNPPDQL